ncbi:Uma2 family endonuclease [Synechococcus moorigangaii CMS01]|nr:Uma2 family endonuclease [Synechococcus moorigangaii CMS01]
MIASPSLSPKKMTLEEYLAWEATQELRYEYVDGEIIAMTGGTITHTRIYLNLYRALFAHLEKRGCEAFVADVKVQDQKNQRYFYPDLVVTCHPDDRRNNQFIQHPTVIVEVLSPSTANYDQSRKLKLYRQISSLQEYVLIDSQHISVALYQRQSGRMWGYSDYGPDETFWLPSIEFECKVADLYENAILEPSDDA